MMDRSNKPKPEPIEEQLTRLYRTAAPDPAFVAKLEERLVQQADRLATGAPPTWRFRLRRDEWRWGSLLVGLALLVICMMAILSLLPDQAPMSPTAVGTRALALPATTQVSSTSPPSATIALSPTALPAEPSASVTSTPAYAFVRFGRANLRGGPGTEYPVVAEVLAGAKLAVLDRSPNGEWIRVAYPVETADAAWIYSPLVLLVEEPLLDEAAGTTSASKVVAGNARREGDSLFVDVCFELPDKEDWTIFGALFQYEHEGVQVEAPAGETSLLSITEPTAEGNPGQRCDALEFHLLAETEISNPRLNVLSIGAYPREGEECATYLDKVQQRLAASQSGIRIACEFVPHVGDQVTVVAWPEGMSQQEAQGIVQQVYMESFTIYGPWIFPLGEANLAPVMGEAGDSPPLVGLQELHASRVSNFPMPGWLHLRNRGFYSSTGEATPALPPTVNEFQLDAWYYLDEQGRLVRAVERRLDNAGRAFQVRVLQDGVWRDLNTQEITPQDMTASFHLDFGFLAEASWAVKAGKQLTRQALFVEGVYSGDQYILEDEAIKKEAVFDPTSGELLSLYTWNVAPGMSGPPGEADLVSSVVILSLETGVEPPAGVLALFTP